MRLAPSIFRWLTVSIFFILISQNTILVAQETRPIQVISVKTGPLISSSFPKAGAVVLTSEIGELDIFADPEPLDTRKRKEGRGKETKYIYTLFLESQKPVRMTVTPTNSLFENYEFTVTVEEKIGQYFDVKLASEKKPQVAETPPAPEPPKQEEKKLVIEEATAEGLEELRSGYGGLILKNTLPIPIQFTTNVEDGFYGTPIVSDDRKNYTVFVMPSVTHIISVQAKDHVSAKIDVLVNPNKYKVLWVGTQKSIEEAKAAEKLARLNSDERKAEEKRRAEEERAKQAKAAQAQAQPLNSPNASSLPKVEESKGGFPWLWVLGGVGLVGAGAVVLLGGGGGGDAGTPTVLPDLPSPPVRPTAQP